MIDRLLEFLTGSGAPVAEKGDDELELAVAALLIEAARMDSNFDASERAVIERLLTEKFDLGDGAVQALIEKADRTVQQTAQYFPFTHRITTRMSAEQRVQVIEMLWKVAYSDGVLDPDEDMLIRQVAGLINVPDKERGFARRRALERLAATRKGPGAAG